MTDRYSEARPCPKCGGEFVETKYDPMQDNLGRRCRRCGYTWREKPLSERTVRSYLASTNPDAARAALEE